MEGGGKIGVRRAALAVAAALAVGLVGAAAAFACSPQATIRATTTSGSPGSVVSVIGEKWDATSPSPVVLRWATAAGPQLASVQPEGSTGVDGGFVTQITIPAGAYNGFYAIKGSQRKADGSNFWVADNVFQVTGSIDPPKPTTTAPAVEEPAAEEAAAEEAAAVTDGQTAATAPATPPAPTATRRPPATTTPPPAVVAEVAPAEPAPAEPAPAEPAPAVEAVPTTPPGEGLPPVSSGGALPLVVSDPAALGGPRTIDSGPSAALVLVLAILGLGVFAAGSVIVVHDLRGRRVKADI